MPYLIDGHNLIPHIPGLTLKDLDDEKALIHLLEDFCRRTRQQVDVYFDRAFPGSKKTQSFGRVIAHFTPEYSTADEAIRIRLSSLKRSAKNWTVVTSDRQVKAEAQAAGARWMSAEEFSKILRSQPESGPAGDSQPELTEDEVNMWINLFQSRKKD